MLLGENLLCRQDRVKAPAAVAGLRAPHLLQPAEQGQSRSKKLIVFDLDGTLAESKAAIDDEMSGLLHELLGTVKVAVISGGDWPQFEKQVVSHLPHDERLTGLSLLPTCGTKFFQYEKVWNKIYSEDFTADEKQKIITSLTKAFEESGFKAEKVRGRGN